MTTYDISLTVVLPERYGPVIRGFYELACHNFGDTDQRRWPGSFTKAAQWADNMNRSHQGISLTRHSPCEANRFTVDATLAYGIQDTIKFWQSEDDWRIEVNLSSRWFKKYAPIFQSLQSLLVHVAVAEAQRA